MTMSEATAQTTASRCHQSTHLLFTSRAPGSEEGRRRPSPVDGTTRHQSSPVSDSRYAGSFEGKVIGALPASALYGTIAASAAAGVPANQIQIFTRDDTTELDSRLDRLDLSGVLARLLLGDPLFDLQQERDEPAASECLLGVPVQGVDAACRVADILHQHGGHGITHLGHWIVTDLA
jgi:hypothetical protein